MLKIPLLEIPESDLCLLKAFKPMCKTVQAKDSNPLFSLPKKKCITYPLYQGKLRETIADIGLNPLDFFLRIRCAEEARLGHLALKFQ